MSVGFGFELKDLRSIIDLGLVDNTSIVDDLTEKYQYRIVEGQTLFRTIYQERFHYDKVNPECNFVSKEYRLLKKNEDYFESPIHIWFGLSYSNYLVMPRLLLEDMSLEWQTKFIDLLEDWEEEFSDLLMGRDYTVQLRDKYGRFRDDALSNYRHGHIEEIRKWEKRRKEKSQL